MEAAEVSGSISMYDKDIFFLADSPNGTMRQE
jgi:hypothetical protein